MPIKPWDEWDWTPEEFVVFSTKNGNPMFVFSIGRLPDIRYDEGCSVHDAFLRMYREAVWGYLEQHNYKGEKFNIDLCFKYGLSNAQKERCYSDTSEVRQLLQENAYRIKALLEKVCRDNAETCNELDGIANAEVDSASVERPDNIPSFPVDSYSPVVPEGLIPVSAVASRKDIVTSCTAEIKQPEDESTRLLRSVDKTMKGVSKKLDVITEGQKQQTEILQQSTLKSAEQTTPPSPEQSKEGSSEKPKPKEIPHDDKYYLSITDHYERPQAMRKDRYTWKEIGGWERKHEDILNADPLNPLPCTNWDAIRKRKPKSKK